MPLWRHLWKGTRPQATSASANRLFPLGTSKEGAFFRALVNEVESLLWKPLRIASEGLEVTLNRPSD